MAIATTTVIDASANAGAGAGEENAPSAADEETAFVFYTYITYLKPKNDVLSAYVTVRSRKSTYPVLRLIGPRFDLSGLKLLVAATWMK